MKREWTFCFKRQREKDFLFHSFSVSVILFNYSGNEHSQIHGNFERNGDVDEVELKGYFSRPISSSSSRGVRVKEYNEQ